MQIFTGDQIAAELTALGITDVIWIPDTDMGRWESALESEKGLSLLRVCREGEAWPLAAGLMLGGRRPLVMMQTTGLYESGDALRNVVYDLNMPVAALIGARNWLTPHSTDTARRFAEPILDAWQLDWRLIACPDDRPLLRSHLTQCRNEHRAGFILLAE